MSDFTLAQGRYLSYIYNYLQLFDVAPIQAEIAEALSVSSSSVNQMLNRLEQKKLIRRPRGTHQIEILIDVKQIPKWKGRRVTRTLMTWVPPDEPAPTRRSRKPTTQQSSEIYCFKITLVGSRPPIWRRIEIGDVTLGILHEDIQTAMGWTNSHLHQFHIQGRRYTDPRLIEHDWDDMGTIDYSDIRISDLVSQHGPKLQMVYEYDFGDGWEHTVVLEKIAAADPDQKYPRCADGKRACPPEDIGGIYGYEEFLEAMRKPKRERDEDYRDWIGSFDPEAFDPQAATKAMRTGLPE